MEEFLVRRTEPDPAWLISQRQHSHHTRTLARTLAQRRLENSERVEMNGEPPQATTYLRRQKVVLYYNLLHKFALEGFVLVL